MSYPLLNLNSAASCRRRETEERASATIPVMTSPSFSVIGYRLVTDSGSCSLSGTLRCVSTMHESVPRTPMEVSPLVLMALKAYSTWYSRPSGEKIVMCRS